MTASSRKTATPTSRTEFRVTLFEPTRPGSVVCVIRSVLESSAAKLVDLYLEATDSAILDKVNETLTMRKIDVLRVLGSLSSRGLVGESDAVGSPD